MINGVTNPAQAATQPPTHSGSSTAKETRLPDDRPSQSDAVELSGAAREQLERAESLPIRSKLVERVRAEIAAGTYLTEEKIDAAVDRIRQEMFVAA